MTRMLAVGLFCLCFGATGCRLALDITENAAFETCLYTDEVRAKLKYHRLASKAWGEYKAAHPDHASSDFGRGFKHGFVEYLDAGGGCGAPPLPPLKYWKPKYQTPEGREATEAWRAGYKEGVAAAKASGRRELVVVPVGKCDPPAVGLTFSGPAGPLPPPPAPARGVPWPAPGDELPHPRPIMPEAVPSGDANAPPNTGGQVLFQPPQAGRDTPEGNAAYLGSRLPLEEGPGAWCEGGRRAGGPDELPGLPGPPAPAPMPPGSLPDLLPGGPGAPQTRLYFNYRPGPIQPPPGRRPAGPQGLPRGPGGPRPSQALRGGGRSGKVRRGLFIALRAPPGVGEGARPEDGNIPCRTPFNTGCGRREATRRASPSCCTSPP